MPRPLHEDNADESGEWSAFSENPHQTWCWWPAALTSRLETAIVTPLVRSTAFEQSGGFAMDRILKASLVLMAAVVVQAG